MDKGLDIGSRRALLAVHAACYGPRARHLAPAVREVLEGTHHGDLAATLAAALIERGAAVDHDRARRALEWECAPHRRLVCLGERDYPDLLSSISVPPPVLFVRGNPALLKSPQIAIVGSRRATRPGCDVARRMAFELAASGLAVTSGLAFGIDAAAHRGALDQGGATLAVLGCGIDRVYPARHERLAAEIAERGALVSEFPLGSRPLKQHFPMRNRIISGLTLGTVVVEAALRSGSISTAMHALEQGREVFAVPGSVNNPVARGCHALIRQGARLTESVLDIFEELGISPVDAAVDGAQSGAARADETPDSAVSEQHRRLLESCGWDPFTIDEIVARSGLTAQNVSSMLLALELAGRVSAHAPGTFVRVR